MAEATPDKPTGIMAETGRIPSYSELHRRANQWRNCCRRRTSGWATAPTAGKALATMLHSHRRRTVRTDRQAITWSMNGCAMSSMQFKCAFLLLGVVFAAAMPFSSALPKTEAELHGGSLVGQFLVATPEIGDPRFHHAVILVVQHNRNGALGIIINRPVEERTWASLMEAIGDTDTGIAGKVRIFAGGPVEPSLGFVVHSSEYRQGATLDIDGHVAVTANAGVLRDIAHDKGPKKSIIAFGYTGWGPGQVEDEIAQRAWFTEPEDPKLIFDEDRDKVWDDAVARRTFPL